MDRLTKAAIATGGAAVLLLGGAGTMAYWTASPTVTGTDFTSGTLSATGVGTHGIGPRQAFAAGTAVALVVPGDKVKSTCSVTVSGTGDHLKVTAAMQGSAGWETENPLTIAIDTVDRVCTVIGVSPDQEEHC